MKTLKLSLANIQGKLSKDEMKKIMAGSGSGCIHICFSNADCITCGMWGSTCNTATNYCR